MCSLLRSYLHKTIMAWRRNRKTLTIEFLNIMQACVAIRVISIVCYVSWWQTYTPNIAINLCTQQKWDQLHINDRKGSKKFIWFWKFIYSDSILLLTNNYVYYLINVIDDFLLISPKLGTEYDGEDFSQHAEGTCSHFVLCEYRKLW